MQKKKLNSGKKTLVKTFSKKGYYRKSYVRKDGIKVKSSYVRPTKVKSHYIKKQGLTTGKKGLIPLKDKRHLKNFGYSFSNKSSEREKSLRAAAKAYGKNWIIHRLTALANIRPKSKKYESIVRKARKDIKYAQTLKYH